MKFLFFLLGLAFLCAYHSLVFASENTQNILPSSIADKISQAGLDVRDVGIWVKPIDGDTPIISHLASTPRIPASTQKLVTTAIALDVLGEQYRWRTRLYVDGVVVGGVLHGNLIIKGGGDPSMTHERLSAMFAQLRGRGIHRIKGDIIVDNSAFLGVSQDVNAFDGQGLRAYNAQPNAFLVNFGTLEVKMTPSGKWMPHSEATPTVDNAIFQPNGNMVAVSVLPKLADFASPKSINGTANSCGIRPKYALSDDTLTITGQVGIGCGQVSEWLTFANADEFIKKSVKGAWLDVDKDFVGSVIFRLPYGWSYHHKLPVLSFDSRPLSEQIYQINQYSNNVMTEQVALSLPLVAGQAVSDYPRSFAMINAWWHKHLNSPAPMMSRASGLCRDCAVMPMALGELLEFAHRQPTFEIFKTSLPIVGQTGTMASFAKRHPESSVIGRAFIKTGRLSNVAGIAGYVMGQSGQMYATVAIINADGAGNNTKVHALLDEVIEWTARQP